MKKLHFLPILTVIFSSLLVFAQEEVKVDSLSASKLNSINAPSDVNDKIEFKNETGNSIITITDEGENGGSITIPKSTPSSTTNKLYFDGSNLKFNGSNLGGSGVNSLNDLSDGKIIGGSHYVGIGSGFQNSSTDYRNTAFGYNSLYNNSLGELNTAIGDQALTANYNGDYNTAVGFATLYSNSAGHQNTAVGTQALAYSVVSQNTAIGYQAMYLTTTGILNTALGIHSLYANTIGYENTAVGFNALENNTTGFRNIAIGHQALSDNTTGNGNVGIGWLANKGNSEGSDNTIVGFRAGGGASSHIKSGNVFLGYQAGYSETDDNKLYIENSNSTSPLIYGDFSSNKVGINGKLGVGTQNPSDVLHVVGASGQNGLHIQVGSATKLRVYSSGGTAIGSSNFSGTPTDGLYVHGDLHYNAALTSVSDKRYKTNIKTLENPIERIKKIRGVSYDWKINEYPERNFTDQKQFGVIAQEVEAIFPELVRTNKDGYKSVDYVKLTPILLEAIKALSHQNQQLKKQNSDLDKRLSKIENTLINTKFTFTND